MSRPQSPIADADAEVATPSTSARFGRLVSPASTATEHSSQRHSSARHGDRAHCISLLPSQPRITAYKQLTLTRDWFAPYQSPIPLVSDGVNVYFNEWEYDDHHGARKVSVNGGESVRLNVPFGDDYVAEIDGITPDKRELLFTV